MILATPHTATRGSGALNRLCPGGFTHYRQSLRVVDYLEKDGKGLNLCWEVRNGIIDPHAWARTMEGCTVRYADHIAFLNHDIEDAVAAGVLNPAALPRDAVQVLGDTKSRRITTMITDLVANSANCKKWENAVFPRSGGGIRCAERLYVQHGVCGQGCQARGKKVDKMIEALYERLCADPTLMPNFYMQMAYHRGNGPCRGGLYFRHER